MSPLVERRRAKVTGGRCRVISAVDVSVSLGHLCCSHKEAMTAAAKCKMNSESYPIHLGIPPCYPRPPRAGGLRSPSNDVAMSYKVEQGTRRSPEARRYGAVPLSLIFGVGSRCLAGSDSFGERQRFTVFFLMRVRAHIHFGCPMGPHRHFLFVYRAHFASKARWARST